MFIDEEKENVDQLPEGIPIVVSGGNNMTTDTSSISVATQNYRIPKTVLKIFGLEESANTETSYLCPACAASIYDIQTER